MKFRVWCDDYHSGPEEGKVYDERDAGAAAEAFDRWRDAWSSDYTIVNGTNIVVHVRREPDGVTEDFEVSGESEPVYHAWKIEE